ncbi:hypothetical protein [Aquabacterium sp.]|uniref:hypothetical protein n=1 Tax=Aquabacterium sp. TaxID=1872578 RepID=UPI002E315D1A|nr:hypothetical protein [Aquabacterium sp.]HEX5312290.1 hypothetical protein [Aquabacterium sp.]
MTVSIVTSVLVLIFIEPLLKLVSKALMWLGENIYSGVTGSIYTSAALGLREMYSFMVLIFLLAAMLGVTTGAFYARHVKREARKQPSEGRSWTKILSILAVAYVIPASIYIISSSFIVLQMNASFNQRITVLSVEATDREIKELRAAWAKMEKRADYEQLNARMSKLATGYRISLPKALWD